MNVTYIEHSGFLVETEKVYLLLVKRRERRMFTFNHFNFKTGQSESELFL